MRIGEEKGIANEELLLPSCRGRTLLFYSSTFPSLPALIY